MQYLTTIAHFCTYSKAVSAFCLIVETAIVCAPFTITVLVSILERIMLNTSLTRNKGYTLAEVLVLISIISLIIGLLLSAIQKIRAASARLQCVNHLKQIGIALHGYHDTSLSFPNGCSFLNGNSTEPHMSWHTRILPFIEQEALWKQSFDAFKQDSFFESEPHANLYGTVIKLYICPSDPATQQVRDVFGLNMAFTDYLGVTGEDRRKCNGILFIDSKIKITDITDGSSNTIFVGERPPSADGLYGWWYAGWGQKKDGSGEMILGAAEMNEIHLVNNCDKGPYQYQIGSSTNQCDMFHFWSYHSGGANFLFADGSVNFIRYSNSPIFQYLSIRAGREKNVIFE